MSIVSFLSRFQGSQHKAATKRLIINTQLLGCSTDKTSSLRVVIAGVSSYSSPGQALCQAGPVILPNSKESFRHGKNITQQVKISSVVRERNSPIAMEKT